MIRRPAVDIWRMIEKIRKEKPLVHHLTNWVTIYDCANIVKALGASPVMAHAKEESGDMAAIASSLVLNIGTLTPEFIESMKIAARSANKKGIPVVLDVCGAGATRLRDEKSFELLNETRIDIIKGNASEVARIAGENIQTKGVDATNVGKDLIGLAAGLAKERKATVVITGREDIVCGGGRHFIVKNGHEMMTRVVGTGCMAASVIGTFAAVEKDLTQAAASALAVYGIAAELAAKEAEGPASFKEKLFDNIYRLDEETIKKMRKVE
jgi:hydroxyethylthiazole kinase